MSEKKLVILFGGIAAVAIIALIAVLIFGAPQLRSQSEARAPQANLNQFGQAVANLGLPECADQAHRFLDKFGQTVRIGAYAFPREEDPQSLTFSMEIQMDGGVTSYGSASVTKARGRQCHFSGEVLTHWIDPCDQVGQLVYTAFSPGQVLNNTLMMYNHKENPRRKLFLLPVTNGCIAVDKTAQ